MAYAPSEQTGQSKVSLPKPGFSSKFDNIILLQIQIEETHSFKMTPKLTVYLTPGPRYST